MNAEIATSNNKLGFFHPTHELDFSHPTQLESVGKKISDSLDPFGVIASMLTAHFAWVSHPLELHRAVAALYQEYLALQAHSMRRLSGLPSEDVVPPHPDDPRFSDPVWVESPFWNVVKEWYLSSSYRLRSMYAQTPGLSDKECRRASFWVKNWVNAVAPTNFFWLNPIAQIKCIESRGESLVNGVTHFLRDAQTKNISMIEPDAFVVGKDLALSPGKVVFRNRLVEIIHYTPSTEKVHALPILIVTPWINKYYILDLTPKKSLIKYLVDQGFSVFVTSWKNPTADMSNVSFGDYLEEGVATTVDAVRDFAGVEKLHLVGYCIGGTLVSTYMAWANKKFGADKVPVQDWTLFTTLTNFSNPGGIEVFIDDSSVEALEESMAQRGYLDGSEMAASFRLLRSNSLIWHYWVHSYLYGETLPAFDVLFWNMDCTRLPYAMHSFYLREMYLKNNLIKRDHLTVAGEPIDLHRIEQPLYAVTAIDDHIVPWKQSYRIRKYLSVKAPMRFVLSTSGHILGIVNPPVNPPKRSYWAGEPSHNEHYEDWLKRMKKQPGTWWTDWVEWLKSRGDTQIPALPVATKKYPALADAPGVYVLEK